jgi:hypothetical protein
MDNRNEHVGKMSLTDRWMMAGLEGNVLLPQSPLAIATFEAAVLLDVDPQQIIDFSAHIFTPEEIEKAAKIMRTQHKKHGISDDLTERIIDRGYLSELLYAEKETIEVLLRLVLQVTKSTEALDDHASKKQIARQLATFLADPLNKEVVATLKKMFANAKEIIRSSSDLQTQYKEWIEREYQLFISKGKRGETVTITERIKNGECEPFNEIRLKIERSWGEILKHTHSKMGMKLLVDLFT